MTEIESGPSRTNARAGVHRALAAATVLAVAACGGGEQAGEAGAGAEEEAAQAGPVVPPDSAAQVTGTVNFTGTPPEPESIDMSEEPQCVEAYGEQGPRTQHVVVSDGKLQNVFVYVKSGLERDFPTPAEPVVLDQEDCRYHPHVLGIQANQTLEIRNSDDLLHNINAKPTTNRGFNISQPAAGMTSTRSFSLTEVMIPVTCDVHGWMNAYVGVLDHPYYAVSGDDGSFSLDDLPPGDYVLEAWHEEYGTLTQNVSVSAQDTASVTFEFSADMAGAEVPLGEPIELHDHAAMATGR